MRHTVASATAYRYLLGARKLRIIDTMPGSGARYDNRRISGAGHAGTDDYQLADIHTNDTEDHGFTSRAPTRREREPLAAGALLSRFRALANAGLRCHARPRDISRWGFQAPSLHRHL